MVLKPKTLDVLVTTNLHAVMLSDLAAALSGSLGIAPTANLKLERQFPSMFEPIHGSAFDITGKGVTHPFATFWTAAADATRRPDFYILFDLHSPPLQVATRVMNQREHAHCRQDKRSTKK